MLLVHQFDYVMVKLVYATIQLRWSKNYSKWIEEFKRDGSILHSYRMHMFNFTVNSDDLTLEPGLSAPLPERLQQVTWLVRPSDHSVLALQAI